MPHIVPSQVAVELLWVGQAEQEAPQLATSLFDTHPTVGQV